MSLARRHQISRLEAFSDAVFAFALTLLVVSLEVPHSYPELMTLVRGFVPFACCFAILVWIWHGHSAFFTHYPLEDGPTIFLNACLLFVVLFYVYPLKYVMNLAFHALAPQANLEPPTNTTEVSHLFVVYGLGYMSVFIIMALLYRRAWSKRRELGLTPAEIFDARMYCGAHLLSAAVGLLSVLWAIGAPRAWSPWAGVIYFLMAPVQTIYGTIAGRRRNKRFAH